MVELPHLFFCSAPQSQERYERACKTLAMWRQVMEVTVLQALPSQCYEFQSLRRKIAEENSKTPIYVVADDDMEPSRTGCIKQWLRAGVRYLEMYPEFGLLSPFLEATNFTRWTPPDYEPFEDDNVQEFHNTGGIRFTRKGIITDWPKQERRGYDQEHCEAIQKAGYRVGYFKKLWAVHPGYKSETWKPVTDFVSPRLT